MHFIPMAFLEIFGEFFGDLQFVLKIFVFLAILNFAKNHLGNSTMTLVVVGLFSYLILFAFWPIFGTIYILYVLLSLGIGAFFVDFFFVSQMSGGQGGEETHGPHGHGGHGGHGIPGAPMMHRPPMPPPMKPG